MHRILLTDGDTRPSKTLRWARTNGYFMLALAGLLISISPVLTTPQAQVLAGFMFLGGMLASWGAFYERWFGEFVGIPLIGAALASLGLITWGDMMDAGAAFLAWSNLLLLLSFAALLIGRWRSVLAVYRVARWFATHDKEQDEQEVEP